MIRRKILNPYFFKIKLLEAKNTNRPYCESLSFSNYEASFRTSTWKFQPFIFIVYFLLTFNWVGMRALPLGSRTRLVTGCSVSKWPKVGALLFIVLCLKAKCSRNLVFKNNLFYIFRQINRRKLTFTNYALKNGNQHIICYICQKQILQYLVGIDFYLNENF